jgi:phage tail sheath gpL-like
LDTRIIPQSTRKPGVYMGFNTTLALSGLPANTQRICFIAPITSKALTAAKPLDVVRVFTEAEALNAFGPVAAEMVSHALQTSRSANINVIGVITEPEKLPSIAAALEVLLGVDMEVVVSSWMDDTSLLELRKHIALATDATHQRSRIGVAASVGSQASASATATAAKLNSGAITLACLPGPGNSAIAVAAAYAAALAAEDDPSRPMNTVELPSLTAPPVANRMSRSEQEAALAYGVTPLEVGPGETVQIVRAISTYTKSPTNTADASLLDITTMRSLYYVREACRSRLRLRFPRAKLSPSTATKVRSEILDVLRKCADDKVAILKNVDAHAEHLIVESANDGTGRLRATIPADIVEGLHVIDATIDLYL